MRQKPTLEQLDMFGLKDYFYHEGGMFYVVQEKEDGTQRVSEEF